MPGISISIDARDNASATLDAVRNKLQIFDQFGRQVSDLSQKFDGVERSISGFDISASKATRAVRGLAVPLVSELSPALGGTASAMGQVISSALILGSGMTALGIAAAGVAGIVGGALITSWREAAAKTAEFDKAQRSLDFNAVTAGLAKEREEVTKLTDALDDLRARAKDVRRSEFTPEAGAVADIMERLFGSNQEEAARKQTARAQRQQSYITGRQASDFARAEQDDSGAGTTTDAASFEVRRRLADIRKQVAESGVLDPIERQFQAAIRDAQNAYLAAPTSEGADVRDEAIRLATLQRNEAIRRRSIGLRWGGDAGYDEAQAFAITPEDILQGSFGAQRKAFEGQEPAGTPGLDDVERFEGLAPQVGVETDRARKAITEADLRDSERLLQIDRDRLLLASQRTDLSVAQRAALDAEAIQADYLLKIDQARGDAAKEFSAEVEKRVRLQQLAERTDPVAGLKRGISDVEQEFGAAGTRMQEAARTVGGDIARSLSDSMLGPVEERLKNLPPLFRSILTSMARAVTDDLGKAITAQLFGGLRGLLGGGGGTPGLTPFDGAGSGGGGPAGGITNVTLNVAGRPLPQSELQTAFDAGGEAGVRALREGRATVAGGQFIPDFGDLPVGGGPSIRTGPQPTLLGSALPIAGSAAALGLTAYSAQGARTGFDVGSSAALGAFAGAGLGRSIGTLFGGAGGSVGAAGGALAGAAITGTMAALAKQAADKQAQKQRQAAEVARAAGAGSDLVSSAGQAQGPADLFRRLTAFGSGTTGGSANPAVITTLDTPQGPKMVGRENPTYPTATLSDLLANPGSIKANIQAGVDPSALAGPNAATSTALQQMATDLVAQFREREQGVGVTEEDRVMPSGLRRRTTVPANLAGTLGSGGDLEIDELALHALSDDDQAALLLDVLGQTAQERDIVSTISDGATDKIVSITRIPRSTITLPPGTTPPPAPVNTGTSTQPAPGPGTAGLITAGGVAAVGVAASLADPNSLLNQLLPSGWKGGDLAQLLQAAFSSSTTAGTAITWGSGATSNIGGDVLRDLNAGLYTTGEGAYGAAFSGVEAGGSAAGLGFGDALSALGGASAVLGLIQGAQTGDPLTIIQSAVSLYSAIASIANSALGTTLPTLGSLVTEAAGSLGISIGAEVAVGAGTGAAAGAAAGTAAAELGAGLTAGIFFAPIAAGMIIKAISDLRAAEVLRNRVATAQRDLKTVIPQAIESVQRDGPATLAIINNPASTPAEVRAAYDRAKSTLDLYNTYDNYFKTGAGAYGAVEVPQLLAIAKQLEPYLNMLHLGMVRATDRLAGTAAVPTDRYQDPFSLASSFGVDAKHAVLTGTAELLAGGPDAVNAYQSQTMDTPYGTVNKAIYQQIVATLQPGQLEQGLKALADLYGIAPAGMTALGFGTQGQPLAQPLVAQPLIDPALLAGLSFKDAAWTALNEQQQRDNFGGGGD